jgi:drug/metabolite transporter (DMT)-like permease
MGQATHGALHIRKGLLITLVGGLLFTLDLPLLRLSLADQWTMVFARGFFMFLSITVIWMIIRRHSRTPLPFIAGGAGVAVAITNTIANISYIGAIVETNAANVVFITALIPVITATMSRLFIGEHVHPFTWLATALSFAGVGVIVWDGVQSGSVWGDLMALISAVCTASAFTIIRASGKNVATSLAIGSLASAVVAALFFDISPQALMAQASYALPAWGWIALNGLITIPLASTLIANGPRFLPSSDVSMFFLLETVLTPVWVWMLFGEVPGQTVLAGGAVVILTLIVHSWWRLNQSLKSKTAAA